MKIQLAAIFLLPSLIHASPLMLAKNHHEDLDVSQYLISEKLDGVRARWTGQQLLSRQGNPIHSPSWFIAPFPDTALDGELWIDRRTFQETTRIVLDDVPDETQWQKIKFMAFDLPEHPGPFVERSLDLRSLILENNTPHLQAVTQFQVDNHEEMMTRLKDVENAGGEGLMLHHKANLYEDGRSAGLLKLKSFDDAEATVVAYHPGKGKYVDMLGSLEVVTDTGIRFKLGTGFSDEERKQPPAIGSEVTYKYFGLTDSGKPRFASFMRVREDHTQ